jgi:hypothetical protein
MFKFLLNLIVQISKVLPKSKIYLNLKIKSVFKPSFEFGPTGTSLPCRPTLLLSRRLPPSAQQDHKPHGALRVYAFLSGKRLLHHTAFLPATNIWAPHVSSFLSLMPPELGQTTVVSHHLWPSLSPSFTPRDAESRP